MDIMWPTRQSYPNLLFIFIEMKFYSFSFLCYIYNEVYENVMTKRIMIIL